MSDTCPACGAGQLTEHVEQIPSAWEGRHGTVPLRYSTCNNCGSELVNAEQARANKGEVLKFREVA